MSLIPEWGRWRGVGAGGSLRRIQVRKLRAVVVVVTTSIESGCDILLRGGPVLVEAGWRWHLQLGL
jgi:hypothetical protein